jgi:vancomycin resistance protein VanJ
LNLIVRLAKYFVFLVVAGAVALSVAYRFSHLQTWWLELTRYAPFPIHLLMALAAVGVSFLLGRAWRLAALGGLVLVATVVMGLVLARGDSGSGPFRLMTYNIKAYLARERADGFEQIAQEVARHDPDIVVMQDAVGADEPLADLPPAVRGMFGTRQVYSFGQYVVASRLPLKDCRPGRMPFRGQAHTYVQCTVVVAGSEIDLVTAHFVSPRGGLNAARHERLNGIGEWQQNFMDRLTQSRRLAADLAGSPTHTTRPLIVAGDLNSLESSPVIRSLLDIGLRDAFSSAGLGYGYTQGHALRPGISFLRIDHILVSSTLGVGRCFVGGSQGSEHRPVIADLLVRRE